MLSLGRLAANALEEVYCSIKLSLTAANREQKSWAVGQEREELFCNTPIDTVRPHTQVSCKRIEGDSSW